MFHRILRIEFTRPAGKIFPIFSYVIRAFKRTRYSHVRLRWVSGSGRNIIYEASGSHVKFVGTLAQEQHKVKIIKTYEIDLDQEHYKGLIDLCMEYADVDYGKLQVLGILASTIFALDKNPFSRGKYSQVCSELVGRFLEQVMNYNVKENLDIAGPLQIDKCLEELVSRKLVRLVA